MKFYLVSFTIDFSKIDTFFNITYFPFPQFECFKVLNSIIASLNILYKTSKLALALNFVLVNLCIMHILAAFLVKWQIFYRKSTF